MTREEIIAKLKAMEPDLRARGITRIQMFGSRARGDERPDSDLDLLVDIASDADASLIEFSGIRLDITDSIGIETYPMTTGALDDRFRREIATDLVQVF